MERWKPWDTTMRRYANRIDEMVDDLATRSDLRGNPEGLRKLAALINCLIELRR